MSNDSQGTNLVKINETDRELRSKREEFKLNAPAIKPHKSAFENYCNTESSSPSVIRITTNFEYEELEKKDEKRVKSLAIKVERKKYKKIEKDFTNSHARKDVIYKAIFRFLKRSLDAQFRSSEYHLKCKKNHSRKSRITIKEVKSFLSKDSNQEPSDDLAAVFIALIDTNTNYFNMDRNFEEFRSVLSKVISKFNSKLLSKCFENEEFS
mmetsp:Transcript_16887/g.18835  ORF Transcript_16887/g.18835 Transcript_16887/m.18835 type:complete len:210 (+) Transcript_16887:10-639(+)